MSDTELRELQRRAEQGDPAARLRWYHKRVQCDDPFRLVAPSGALHDDVDHRGAFHFAPTPIRPVIRLQAYACDNVAWDFFDYSNPALFDHLAGICTCGECSWEQGVHAWSKHLIPYAESLNSPLMASEDVSKSQDFSHHLAVRVSVAIAGVVFPAWMAGLYQMAEEAPQDRIARPWDTVSRIEVLCQGIFTAAEAWLRCPCAIRLKQWTSITDGTPPFIPYPSFQMVKNQPDAHWLDQISDAQRYAEPSVIREAANEAVLSLLKEAP